MKCFRLNKDDLNSQFLNELNQLNQGNDHVGYFGFMSSVGRHPSQIVNGYSDNLDHVSFDNPDADHNYYMTPNTFSTAHRSKKNLGNLLCFFADIDTMAKGGINPILAATKLRKYFNNHPGTPIYSYLQNSGHGLYWIILISDPVPVTNRTLKDWKITELRFLQYLGKLTKQILGTDCVDYGARDPSRLLHLVGTTNVKYLDPKSFYHKPASSYMLDATVIKYKFNNFCSLMKKLEPKIYTKRKNHTRRKSNMPTYVSNNNIFKNHTGNLLDNITGFSTNRSCHNIFKWIIKMGGNIKTAKILTILASRQRSDQLSYEALTKWIHNYSRLKVIYHGQVMQSLNVAVKGYLYHHRHNGLIHLASTLMRTGCSTLTMVILLKFVNNRSHPEPIDTSDLKDIINEVTKYFSN